MHGVLQIDSSELAESYHIPKPPVQHPPHKRPGRRSKLKDKGKFQLQKQPEQHPPPRKQPGRRGKLKDKGKF